MESLAKFLLGVMLFLLGISWLLLPYIVCGIRNRLDTIIEELRKR